MSGADREERLEQWLRVILDHVDYTSDPPACSVVQAVGAILPSEVIKSARSALDESWDSSAPLGELEMSRYTEGVNHKGECLRCGCSPRGCLNPACPVPLNERVPPAPPGRGTGGEW